MASPIGVVQVSRAPQCHRTWTRIMKKTASPAARSNARTRSRAAIPVTAFISIASAGSASAGCVLAVLASAAACPPSPRPAAPRWAPSAATSSSAHLDRGRSAVARISQRVRRIRVSERFGGTRLRGRGVLHARIFAPRLARGTVRALPGPVGQVGVRVPNVEGNIWTIPARMRGMELRQGSSGAVQQS